MIPGDAERRAAHCSECGEELWGHAERFGLCVGCQNRERDEMYERVEAWTDEDEAAYRAEWDAEFARCTPRQLADFLGELS